MRTSSAKRIERRGGGCLSVHPLHRHRSANVVVARELDLAHRALAEEAHAIEPRSLLGLGDWSCVSGFFAARKDGRSSRRGPALQRHAGRRHQVGSVECSLDIDRPDRALHVGHAAQGCRVPDTIPRAVRHQTAHQRAF